MLLESRFPRKGGETHRGRRSPLVTIADAGRGAAAPWGFFFPDCRGWTVTGCSAEAGTWETSPEPLRAGSRDRSRDRGWDRGLLQPWT